MSKIQSLLITAKISDENKAKLNAMVGEENITYLEQFSFAEMGMMAKRGASREEIMQKHKEYNARIRRIAEEKHIDSAVIAGNVDDNILASPDLKWVHRIHAGAENSAKAEIFERGIVLTSSAGRSAPAIAEHAMMFILNCVYAINGLVAKQKAHDFSIGSLYRGKTGLMGKTVAIIGLGHNGSDLAVKLKGFGVRVLGYDRFVRPVEGVDEVLEAKRENLERIARESDFIVLCVSLNNATFHMIDKEILSMMKPSAFLVNIARGGLVDEKALIEALQNNQIGGAALDTVENEPLSADSPLWDMENVLITPHTSPVIPDKDDREWEYVFQNVKAFQEDGQFVNRFTAEDVFTVGK